MPESNLTVAVTGPTGTFGFGLVPLLQADERIARIVGIARRPFDANEHGWTKLTYRRGDVRDPAALEEGFQGADVVVHLAFMITGAASLETIRQINIDGTLNAFRAPTAAAHLFYAQEKAQIERLLIEEAAGELGPGVFLLRPPVVLGPDTVGAKNVVPGLLVPLVRVLGGVAGRMSLPVITPPVSLQFIHEDDVGQAFLLCVVGAGAPGVYNITGDGVLSGAQVLRELGLTPIPAPARLLRAAARAVAGLPFAPPVAGWAEAFSHPAIMDAGKAKQELGWRPRYSSLEALRDTLNTR